MTPATPHLLLIGLRGAGKSTVGHAIARRQHVTFTDLDAVVLDHLECDTVRQAWDQLGQDAFREAETVVLTALLASQTRVIALGGGTPTAPGAPEAINDARRRGRAFVAYLRCTPQQLVQRLTGHVGDDRPPLLGADTLQEMATIYTHRDPLYKGIADAIIEDAPSPEATIQQVMHAWIGASRGQ